MLPFLCSLLMIGSAWAVMEAEDPVEVGVFTAVLVLAAVVFVACS